MEKPWKEMMNFFMLFEQFKTFCGLLSLGFCVGFFQFEVARKSEDGWICLESLLWMSLIWWFVKCSWSFSQDPGLDLPNVCASSFNTIPGVSTVHLKLLLNRSYEALSSDHFWNGTWITGSMLKIRLLIHTTNWLRWSYCIKSLAIGGWSVWEKEKKKLFETKVLEVAKNFSGFFSWVWKPVNKISKTKGWIQRVLDASYETK